MRRRGVLCTPAMQLTLYSLSDSSTIPRAMQSAVYSGGLIAAAASDNNTDHQHDLGLYRPSRSLAMTLTWNIHGSRANKLARKATCVVTHLLCQPASQPAHLSTSQHDVTTLYDVAMMSYDVAVSLFLLCPLSQNLNSDLISHCLKFIHTSEILSQKFCEHKKKIRIESINAEFSHIWKSSHFHSNLAYLCAHSHGIPTGITWDTIGTCSVFGGQHAACRRAVCYDRRCISPPSDYRPWAPCTPAVDVAI